MGFKKYTTEALYSAVSKPTDGSEVSLVEATGDVKFDGVNVSTTTPTIGDVVFLDENNSVVYLKGGDQLVPANIPNTWTHVGYVYMRKGDKVGIINKIGSDLKYADVVQFKVTIPNETSTLSLGAQYITAGTTDTISVEYTAGMDLATTANTYEENTTTLCGLINTALANLEGITGTWWAYMDDNGDVILQRDTWTDYHQYTCSGSLTFVTWGDMPASSTYWKVNGKHSSSRGIMNLARGVYYWSTNGRTPTAAESLGTAGDTDPVTLAAFTSSEYCSALRETYSTYEEYIEKEFKIMYPQDYGTFSLPDAKTLSLVYAAETALTKDGQTKAKYPAFNACYNILYNAIGLGLHDWYLPSSLEGCYLMDDDTLALLAPSITKMNTTTITNSVYRWFSERSNVYRARYFHGNTGNLGNNHVYDSGRVLGVALLDL